MHRKNSRVVYHPTNGAVWKNCSIWGLLNSKMSWKKGKSSVQAPVIPLLRNRFSLAQSCPALWDPRDCSLPGSSVHGFPRQEHWNAFLFPPPGIFPTQGSNLCLLHLLHWQVDSLPLSHLGNPRNKLLGFRWGKEVDGNLLPGVLLASFQSRHFCPLSKLACDRVSDRERSVSLAQRLRKSLPFSLLTSTVAPRGLGTQVMS